jgi:hypothetical protein
MKQALKVYVGQADKCFCGCSGKYFYADNPADKKDYDKAIAKFNKLGCDDGDDTHDVSYADKKNTLVALYY